MGNIFARIVDPGMNIIRNKRINSILVPRKNNLDSLGRVLMTLLHGSNISMR